MNTITSASAEDSLLNTDKGKGQAKVIFLSRYSLSPLAPREDRVKLNAFTRSASKCLEGLVRQYPSLEIYSPDRPPYEVAFIDIAYTLGINVVLLTRQQEISKGKLLTLLPNQKRIQVAENISYEEYANSLDCSVSSPVFLISYQFQLLVPPTLRRVQYLQLSS